MTDATIHDTPHGQPVPVDPTSLDAGRVDAETPDQKLSALVAETAAAVTGVHHLGGTASRALDRASRRVLGTSTVPGVTVSHLDGGTIVDLDLVVEYPKTISEVIESVRTQVTRAATQQSASEPVEVNVNVTDVHGPFDRVVPANEEIDPADSLAARASAAADTIQTKASEAASTATEAASSATDTAADAISQGTDAVTARAADTIAAAADVVSNAAETVEDAVDSEPAPVATAPKEPVEVSESADAEPSVIVVVPVVVEADDTAERSS